MNTLNIFSQIMIATLGLSAVWLVGLKGPVRKYGFICGICAQPFWMYTTWVNEQWGILTLTLFYGYSWYNGLRNYYR